jgi:heme oxygenase (biliverdin-IX-beta and delta-forming)
VIGRAHAALRDATRAAHDRVDAIFASADLRSREGYRQFLCAHAAAFLPVEAALEAHGIGRIVADWSSRSRGELLRADLEEIGAHAVPDAAPCVLTGDEPALLGAVYVLEGSRLGGRVLARSVAPGLPVRYLSAAPAEAGGWRKLLALLEVSLYSEARIASAVAAATSVFDRFEKAGRTEWKQHQA